MVLIVYELSRVSPELPQPERSMAMLTQTMCRIIGEQGLTAATPLGDVVGNLGNCNPSQPGHRRLTCIPSIGPIHYVV